MNNEIKKGRRQRSKSFQFRYTAMVIILMIIISVAVGMGIFTVTWDKLSGELGIKTARQIDAMFMDVKGALFWRVFFVIWSGVSIAGLITICLIHPMAGPLFRVNKIARMVSRGVIPAGVRFRKTDRVYDLTKSLNEMILRLDGLRVKNTEILDRSRSYLKQVTEGLSPEDPKDLKGQLDKLAKCIDEFEIFAREDS